MKQFTVKTLCLGIALLSFLFAKSTFAQTVYSIPDASCSSCMNGTYAPVDICDGEYTAEADIYAAGSLAHGTVTSVAFNQISGSQSSVPVKIYLKTTSASTLSSQTWSNAISGASLAFSGNVSFTGTGWKTISLATPFNYSSGNLEVLVECDWGTTSTCANNPIFYYYTVSNNSDEYWENYTTSASALANETGYTDVYPMPVQVTITPPCSNPTISSQPSTATQNLCQNGSATALSLTASGSSLSYQWYSNTTASNSGGTAISGATASSYTPATAATGTTYYYCIVHSTGTCATTSNVSGAVVVNTPPSISSQSTGAQTLCQNSTATAFSVTASGASLSYQWYSNTTASNSGGTAISGATSSSYTPATAVAGTLYYYCVVSGAASCSPAVSAVSGAVVVNATPAAPTGSASQVFCGNTNPTVASLSATGSSIKWYAAASGGTALSGATALSNATSYYASQTVNGCESASRLAVAVTIHAAPSVAVSPAAPAYCTGGAASLTASGASTYSWSPATGLSATTGATVTANPTATTTYTVTGTDANGCVGTQTVTVTVNPLPTVAVNPAAPAICTGSSTSLTASGASSYSWSPATGLSATTGATVTANPATTTTYTVTGTSTSGCVNTQTVTVTVNPLPTVAVTAASSTICYGNSTSLTASGASTYSWSPATGLSATTGATVTANPTATTTYTVTGTNTNGCSATASTTISVNPAISASISGSNVTCAGGNNGSATASVSGGTSPYSYLWNTSQTTASISNLGAGTYHVTVTDNTGCTGTASVNITQPAAQWTAMGTGTCDIAYAVCADGSNAYVGISYGNCGTNNFLLKWDGTSWSNLGYVNGTIFSIAVNGSDIYVGGSFTQAGGTTVNNIAVYHTGSASWSAMGSGTNGTVNALTIYNNTLYAAGEFTTMNGSTMNHIAAWDLNTSSWSALGSGMSGAVYALAMCNGHLYAGGQFTSAGGTTVNNIAEWTGSTWTTLTAGGQTGVNGGTVITPQGASPAYDAPVMALTANNNILYVGGDFNNAGGTSGYNNIASWNTNNSNWSKMSNGGSTGMTVNNGDNANVYALTNFNGNIIAGGDFQDAGGVAVNFTAKWDGSAWSALSTGSGVLNSDVFALAAQQGLLYAGGQFSDVASNLNYVAEFSGAKPVIAPAAATICSGDSTTLTASGASTYSWSPATGLSATTGATVNAFPTTTTTYTVSGTNAQGCVYTQTVTVTVHPLPTVAVTPSSATICSGDSAALTASGASTYSWTPATGLSASTGAVVMAAPGATTTYTVTGTDGNGCRNMASTAVNVNGPFMEIPADTIFNFSFSSQIKWFSFVDDSIHKIIELSTDSDKIVKMELYTGTCTNFNLIDSASIDSANAPYIALDEPNLTPGNTYYLKIISQIGNQGSINSQLSLLTVLDFQCNRAISPWQPCNLINNPGFEFGPVPSHTQGLGLGDAYCWYSNHPTNFATLFDASVPGGNNPSNGCNGDGYSVSIPYNIFSSGDVGIHLTGTRYGELNGGSDINCTFNQTLQQTVYYFGFWTAHSACGFPTTGNPTATGNFIFINDIGANPLGAGYNDLITTLPISSSPLINSSDAAGTWYQRAFCLDLTGASSSDLQQAIGMNISVSANYTAHVFFDDFKLVKLADAGPDKDICQGTVQIGPACPIVDPNHVKYSWSPTTGLDDPTASNPFASPTVTTTYTVTVTMYDDNGVPECSAADDVTVTVHASPAITISSSANAICSNNPSPVTLTATDNNNTNPTYSWSPSTGLSATTGASVTANPPSTTTYTVTATNADGCTDQATVTVTVVGPPDPLNGNHSICQGGSVAIGVPPPTLYHYSWSPSTGLSCDPCSNPTASPSATTTYTVYVTFNLTGCTSNPGYVTVTVSQPPDLPQDTSYSICQGQSVNLNPNASSSYTYSWSEPAPGGTLSCNSCANPTATPSVTTTYSVTVTDANGCTNSGIVTVNVDNPGIPLTNSYTICEGASQNLNPNYSPSSTYTWTEPAPGGTLSCSGCSDPTTSPDPTASPTVTTTYSVTATDGSCTSSGVVTVNVGNPDLPTPATYSICQGSSQALNPNGNSSYTYNWSAPASGGGTISNAADVNPTVTPTAAGTYTYSVTVTDANGCSNSGTVTVNVSPLPDLPTPATYSICLGSSQALNPNGSSSYTYNWSAPASGGGTISNTADVNPTVTPTAAGTYTYNVTETDANGCSNSGPVVIDVHDNPTPPRPVTYIICSGGSHDLNPTYTSSSDTYVWSEPAPGGTLSCLSCTDPYTSPDPIASPTVNTTYTVTVTDPSTGCQSTGTVSIAIDNTNTYCCAAPDPYSYTSATTYTSNLPASITTPKIYISNTFDVNSNFTFSDCQSIAMAPNAEIDVESGATLTITDSRLWACQDMWNGIVVKPGGTLIVQGDGANVVTPSGQSIIEDAKAAIEGQSNSTATSQITVNNSILNNNYIDIHIDPYSSSFSNPYPLTLQSSILTTSQDGYYSPNAYLKAPYQNYITHQGIYLDNVAGNPSGNIVIGDASSVGYKNTFSNMNYGIDAVNFNFEVYNNLFQDIHGYGIYYAPYIGIAIRASGTNYINTNPATDYTMLVGGALPNEQNAMVNCYRGVDATNYFVSRVINNVITNLSNIPLLAHPPVDGDIGIFIKQVAESGDAIDSNLIVNCTTGIYLLGNVKINDYGDIYVSSNRLYVTNANDGNMQTGILLQDGDPKNQNYTVKVQRNSIDSAAVCIKVSDWVQQFFYITNNPELRILPYPASFNVAPLYLPYHKEAGIWVENVHNSNEMFIAQNPKIYSTLSNLGTDAYHPNYADTSLIGIYSVLSGGIVNECNTMYDVGQCIRYDGRCYGTRMFNNHMAQTGQCYDGLVLESNGIIQDQRYYDNTTGTYGPIGDQWPPTPQGNGFIRSQTYMETGSDPTNSRLYVAVAPTVNKYNPNYPFLGYSSASGPLQSLIPQGGTALNCGNLSFMPTAPGSGGAAYRIDNTNSTASTLSPEQKDLDKIAEDSLGYQVLIPETKYINKLWLYGKLHEDSTLLQGDTVLQNFFSQTQGNNMGAIYSMEQAIRGGDYATAQSINSGLSPANGIEQNYQTVNNILFQTIAIGVDTIDSLQYNTLYGIASLCPLESGRAVYKARYMLDFLMDRHIPFTDNCSDSVPPQRIAGIDQKHEYVQAKVYPNPANTVLHVDMIQKVQDVNNSFCLYNATGQRVKCVTFNSMDNTLSIGTLPTGLYYYRLKDVNGKVLKTGKLTIVH